MDMPTGFCLKRYIKTETQLMEQLIQQLANVKPDKKPFAIKKGISGLDITKPIPLHNILFSCY